MPLEILNQWMDRRAIVPWNPRQGDRTDNQWSITDNQPDVENWTIS